MDKMINIELTMWLTLMQWKVVELEGDMAEVPRLLLVDNLS